MAAFLLWLILLVVCWPLALLALILVPLAVVVAADRVVGVEAAIELHEIDRHRGLVALEQIEGFASELGDTSWKPRLWLAAATASTPRRLPLPKWCRQTATWMRP